MGLSKSGRIYVIKHNVPSDVTIMDSWSACADEIEVDRVTRFKIRTKCMDGLGLERRMCGRLRGVGLKFEELEKENCSMKGKC